MRTIRHIEPISAARVGAVISAGLALVMGLPAMICQMSAVGMMQGMIGNLNASYAEYARQYAEQLGESPPPLPVPELAGLINPTTIFLVWVLAFGTAIFSGAVLGGTSAFLYNATVRWTGGIEVEVG